jgi:hypothetical protein
MYSQFNIMCSYLWWNKREEYRWYIHDQSPWWNGFSPPPAWGQFADKNFFPKEMRTIVPYIADHMIAEWVSRKELSDRMVFMMSRQLCFPLPRSKLIASSSNQHFSLFLLYIKFVRSMQNQLNFTRNNHRYTFGTGPSCDKYNIAA